jgi:hypothetical protein
MPPTRYNLRVVETLAAARILSRHPGTRPGVRPRDRITLHEVVDRFGGEPTKGWSQDSAQLRAVLERTIEHIGKLRLANASMDEQEAVTTMIEWSGLPDQDVYLSWLNGSYLVQY